MSVKIKPIDIGEKYEVNGKIVYLDSNENWIASQELTTNEVNAFGNYRQAIIENKNIKKHPKITYKFN